MQQPHDYDLLVIGAGVTGLCAAHYARLVKLQSGEKPRVLVIESSGRAGGKIRSEYIQTSQNRQFLLEWGADSMLSTKPEGIQLAKELGLEDQLIETKRERQIYMLKKGQLRKLPEGLQLVIPKRLWPFVKSPLFSLRAKSEMALDLIKPRRSVSGDESIASFIRRRLGREALDLLAEPILSGIYSANPERQSLLATFPQLAELENRYRSLILGALNSTAAASTGERRHSLFVSFRDGMQTLIDALSNARDSEILLNTRCEGIEYDGSGFKITLSSRESIRAAKVIVTTPATVAAKLLEEVSPNSSHLLAQMRHTSSGCVYLAYEKKIVSHPLTGYGILIPKVEGRQINAVTWVSSKMEGRAPKDRVLFRVFFGGERHPEMMQLNDDEIAEIAQRELSELHQISFPPEFWRVFRSLDGNPQYDVGHLDKVEQIQRALPDGLVVTGCAMRGVGIPDCIRQAKIAVGELF